MMLRSIKNIFSKRDRSESDLQEESKLKREETAAILLQKHIRGFVARKKYGVKQLHHDEMQHYPAFVVGNDPKMPAELDHFHQAEEKIALVGTSGLRALSIACQLGNAKHTPKIILIDNSREVCEFWLAIREYAGNPLLADTAENFLGNLSKFLHQHRRLYRNLPDYCTKNDKKDGVSYLNQNISKFLSKLIDKYGYGYMRAVLMHATVLKQSWADTDVFVKVKNILAHQGVSKIFMYPSNIAACVMDDGGELSTVELILENIRKTAPVLAIHTDDCVVHGVPEKVYLLENHETQYVVDTLFPHHDDRPVNGGGFGGMPGVIVIRDINDLVFLMRMLGGDNRPANTSSRSYSDN